MQRWEAGTPPPGTLRPRKSCLRQTAGRARACARSGARRAGALLLRAQGGAKSGRQAAPAAPGLCMVKRALRRCLRRRSWLQRAPDGASLSCVHRLHWLLLKRLLLPMTLARRAAAWALPSGELRGRARAADGPLPGQAKVGGGRVLRFPLPLLSLLDGRLLPGALGCRTAAPSLPSSLRRGNLRRAGELP